METDDKKVAWILGAGFSKPLGGPLLNGLISPQMAGDFVNWHEFHEHPTSEGYDKINCAEAVLRIYERGCAKTNATYWTNPEEFLDRLDWAARDSTNLWALRIWKLGPAVNIAPDDKVSVDALQEEFVRNVRLLRREAIRFIAGACSYFTSNARNVNQLELWAPYFAGRTSCAKTTSSSRSTTTTYWT